MGTVYFIMFTNDADASVIWMRRKAITEILGTFYCLTFTYRSYYSAFFCIHLNLWGYFVAFDVRDRKMAIGYNSSFVF